MDAKIILGMILQKFIDDGYSRYKSYKQFGYIRHTNNSVIVSRQKGKDSTVPFSKLLIGIRGYQNDINKYDSDTTAIRTLGVTHVTSPVFSLLHLLPKEAYYKLR